MRGTLTSPTLMAMLRADVARSYPEIGAGNLDKVSLLDAVMARHGWRAVFELGVRIHTQRTHPVVRSLVALGDPRRVADRWTRLERFGHSLHRTQVIDAPAGPQMTLRHFALDGRPIAAVNDLYTWGLWVGLLDAAGAADLVATLTPLAGPPFVLVGGAAPIAGQPAPRDTDLLTVGWRAVTPSEGELGGAGRTYGVEAAEPRAPGREAGDALRRRLEALLATDLLRRWTLEVSARALSVSRRSLQRALRAERTTFSATVQRARVEAARGLLENAQLTLAEVAFCTGFSDHAHFTRTFRRHFDVPPSALRELCGSIVASHP